MKSNPMIKFHLPFELTNNNGGRSQKWFSSSILRKKFEKNLRLLGYVRTPFDHPVIVKVVRVLGPKQSLWDSSSIGRGNYKELEDAMVACGWFYDDSPKFIKQTLFDQDSTRRKQGPSVEIIITPANVDACMSREDAANTLRHISDDHPCCSVAIREIVGWLEHLTSDVA